MRLLPIGLVLAGLSLFGAAAVVAGLGLGSTSGDPRDVSSPPTGTSAPPPPYRYARIKRLQPGQTTPSVIAIFDEMGVPEEIAYDPPTLFDRVRSTPGWYWDISYDDDPNDSLLSFIFIRSPDELRSQGILPWDAPVFQPLLDYLGAKLQVRTDVTPQPTNTPTPSPSLVATTITFKGQVIVLAPGIGLGSAIVDCVAGSRCVNPYIISRGNSFVSFTD